MLPLVHHGVFQIEHHARRARVEHLYHQVRVVRWACHLVALVLTPRRQFNSPASANRVAGKPVRRIFSVMGPLENALAFFDQRLLPGSEAPMQWGQKFHESLGQVELRIKGSRRTIHLKAFQSNIADGYSGHH